MGPLDVADITKSSCKLKWKKPEDDGGTPIEYYEIEKLDPHTGQWIPCGKSVEPEANITGLQEGKPYKFRVRAVNKEGESEELETDHSIIAKNPFGKKIPCCYLSFIYIKVILPKPLSSLSFKQIDNFICYIFFLIQFLFFYS